MGSHVEIYLASTASERGRLHVALPLEGATRAPLTDMADLQKNNRGPTYDLFG